MFILLEMKLRQQVQAIAIRQVDIQEDHVEQAACGSLLSFMERGDVICLMPAVLHQVRQGRAHQVIIINNQDLCHVGSSMG